MKKSLMEKWKRLFSGKPVVLSKNESEQMKKAARNILASIESLRKMGRNPLKSARSIARKLKIYGGKKLRRYGSKIVRKNCGCKKRRR